MKQLFILLTILGWSYRLLAADTAIVFSKVKYADVFELAKKENKAVMLYFHFDECGACAKMEQTAFKNKLVVDYFNANIISFEINTKKGEGIETNQLYKVKLHPTFLFFDRQGNEVHKMVGVFSPEDFYKQVNEALLSKKNLSSYKQAYQAGNREPDFLYEYSHLLRDGNELDSFIINEYLNTQSISNLSTEKNIKYIYEFAIHRGNECIAFNSRIYHYILNNKEQFTKYFDAEQVDTRLMFIVLKAVNDATRLKDIAAFEEAIEALKKYDVGKEYELKEKDGRVIIWTTSKTLVLSSKMAFYEKIGDVKNYNLAVNQYIEKVWNNAEELNNFAWGIYEKTQDKETEKIKTAIKCSIRSIALDNNYANNDTYAWLLYKSGQLKKALKQAEKTIAIAKQNNQKYGETQKLVDLITNKKS